MNNRIYIFMICKKYSAQSNRDGSCISVQHYISVECRGGGLVWCCWCNCSSSGCQLWSNLHKGINIAQFSLLSIFLFQWVPIRLCRRVQLTSHWLLDPILTIMSLSVCSLYFLQSFDPLAVDTILGQSRPANTFLERKKKKITWGQAGG